MKKIKTVESNLECKSTAGLLESVIEDLTKEDKRLDELLERKKEKDDTQDPPKQLPS